MNFNNNILAAVLKGVKSFGGLIVYFHIGLVKILGKILLFHLLLLIQSKYYRRISLKGKFSIIK